MAVGEAAGSAAEGGCDAPELGSLRTLGSPWLAALVAWARARASGRVSGEGEGLARPLDSDMGRPVT